MAPKAKKRPRGRPPKSGGGAAEPDPKRDATIAFASFVPDESFARLSGESPLKNAETKALLCSEAVMLHEHLLRLRARADDGVLTADESRAIAGMHNRLLATYKMLRVDIPTVEDDDL